MSNPFHRDLSTRLVAGLIGLIGCFPSDAPAQDREARIGEGKAIVDVAVAPVELEAHVGYLASDELAGRDTGSEGERLATAYIAERLAACGIEPAGDDGYLQRVPLAVGAATDEPSLIGITGDGERVEYAFGVDFSVYTWGSRSGRLEVVDAASSAAIEAAPRCAVFVDESGSARRAVGSRLVELGQEAPALAILRGPKSPGRAGGRLPTGRLGRMADVDVPPILRARGNLLEDLEAGRLGAIEVDLRYAFERTEAHNVVARIPGRGTPERPELADEVVVLSAHIDHLGVRPPSEGEAEAVDSIYNGADDDASGVAALLEVAESIALGGAAAREVVLLFATGEERGLLGTYEYLDRPVAPLERTCFNLNFEMLGRPDVLAGGAGQMWLTGYERTTLGPGLAALGIELTPDPRPEQNFFMRSDNIAFVYRDIPGQTLSSYDLHEDYHTAGDEWHTLDYEHMAAAVTLAVRATRAVVDGEVELEWLEGGRIGDR
ncbi:MAG: M28 family peptidase [Planctomycetota bacterium]